MIYPSLEAYIDATRAALVADVHAYQAEVAAFEAAHRKRRREALKAEPVPPERILLPWPRRRARGGGSGNGPAGMQSETRPRTDPQARRRGSPMSRSRGVRERT